MSYEQSGSPVVEGEVVGGKYRVTRILGVGGMGVVVAATQLDLNRRVALKFLLPMAAAHPDYVLRFGREARAAAQIHSEHVARVFDVGTLETGAPYIVMEHLNGKDLQQQLEESGPLDASAAVGHVLQACEAVAEAHSLGIVHRDLKPANLFLATMPNGRNIIKVLDFGISKSPLVGEQSDLTKGATMMGSPSYMSPEQIKAARSVDVRADQWSIGVILYELLTGLKPFQADTMAELVWVILDRASPKLRASRPDLSPELEAVIDRCLAKEPDARYANVAELAIELAPFGPEWSRDSITRTSHVLGIHPAVRAAARPAPRVAVQSTAISPVAVANADLPSGVVSSGDLDGHGIPISLGSDSAPVEHGSPAPPSVVVTDMGAPAPADGGMFAAPSEEQRAAAPAAVAAMTNPPWSQSVATPATHGVADKPASPSRARVLVPVAFGGVAMVLVLGLLLTVGAAKRVSEGWSARPAAVSPLPTVLPSADLSSDPQSSARQLSDPLPSDPRPSAAEPASGLPLQAASLAPPPPAPPAPSSLPTSSPTSLGPSRARGPAATAHSANALGAASVTSSSAPATKPCTTVTFFDADGMKHFKQQCP